MTPARGWLLCALALAWAGGADGASEELGSAEAAEAAAFKERVEPLISDFIFSRYEQFRASELTFRDLKEHVAEALGMTYEALKADHLSLAIEDATDAITNTCDAGDVPLEACKRRMAKAHAMAREAASTGAGAGGGATKDET